MEGKGLERTKLEKKEKQNQNKKTRELLVQSQEKDDKLLLKVLKKQL